MAEAGIDPAGTDNSTDVTLAGTPNYLTIAGQVITLGNVNAASEITGVLPIANVPETTAAQYRNNTTGKLLSTDKVWSAMGQVTLTDAASIAWDMSSGIDFTVTLGGLRTLANPTSTQIGKKGRIQVAQDATGSRTLGFGANFEFAGGTAPVLTTTAGAKDFLYYDCISSTRILISSILDVK